MECANPRTPMKNHHIATYLTRSGKIALRIEQNTARDGEITYSYTGKHATGSGHRLPHVLSTLRLILQCHKGIRLHEGIDLFLTEHATGPFPLPNYTIDTDHPGLAIRGNGSFPSTWDACSPYELAWLSRNGSSMQRVIANRYLTTAEQTV